MVKVRDKLNVFTPRDKDILKDLAGYLCSLDPNTPCALCIHEYECLDAEHYCPVSVKFWKIFERFLEELETFCEEVAARLGKP